MLLRLEFWVLKEAGEDAEELFLQILDARIGTYSHWRMNNEQNGPFLRTVKCLICSFEVDFFEDFYRSGRRLLCQTVVSILYAYQDSK